MKKICIYYFIVLCSGLYTLNAADDFVTVDYHFVSKELSNLSDIENYCAFVNRDLSSDSSSIISAVQLKQWMDLQQRRFETVGKFARAQGILTSFIAHALLDETQLNILEMFGYIGLSLIVGNYSVKQVNREAAIHKQLGKYSIKDAALEMSLQKHLGYNVLLGHAVAGTTILGVEAALLSNPLAANLNSLSLNVRALLLAACFAEQRDTLIDRSVVKSRQDFLEWQK